MVDIKEGAAPQQRAAQDKIERIMNLVGACYKKAENIKERVVGAALATECSLVKPVSLLKGMDMVIQRLEKLGIILNSLSDSI